MFQGKNKMKPQKKFLMKQRYSIYMTIVVKRITELRQRKNEQRENFNKEMESTK